MNDIPVAIALGSNLGDSLTILKTSLEKLDKTPGVRVKICSRWYETAPIGPPQPDYINACAILEVKISPQELLEILLSLETEMGRIRRQKWGARPLDLDVLLFSDLILDTPSLKIPHPRMTERGFVLVPLAEIAPNWLHPLRKQTISTLVQNVDISGVHLLNFESVVHHN